MFLRLIIVIPTDAAKYRLECHDIKLLIIFLWNINCIHRSVSYLGIHTVFLVQNMSFIRRTIEISAKDFSPLQCKEQAHPTVAFPEGKNPLPLKIHLCVINEVQEFCPIYGIPFNDIFDNICIHYTFPFDIMTFPFASIAFHLTPSASSSSLRSSLSLPADSNLICVLSHSPSG